MGLHAKWAIIAIMSFAATACSSESVTTAYGLSGTYRLRSINGYPVPLTDPSCCNGTVDSGFIRVRTKDTIQVDLLSSTPPANGMPGTMTDARGFFVLKPIGDRFALEPGALITLGSPVDTLFVNGDTIAIVESVPRWQSGVRSVRRYTR